MKLLFDHNLSYKLAKRLNSTYPGSISAKAAGLSTATDIEVWKYAKDGNFILVTQDADFIDWNRLFGVSPKIIWIRFGNRPVDFTEKKLIQYFDKIQLLSSDNQIEILEIG